MAGDMETAEGAYRMRHKISRWRMEKPQVVAGLGMNGDIKWLSQRRRFRHHPIAPIVTPIPSRLTRAEGVGTGEGL